MVRSYKHPMKWGLILGLIPGFFFSSFIQGKGLAWEPRKPVDFIIMAGKGGGADKMARLMQSVIGKHKFSSKPFIPINKPGGSGAEALIHPQAEKGR